MKSITSQSGFTLIEAMVAVLILAIGILTLYTMQVTSIKGNAKANALSYAANAANDVYERLQNIDYDDTVFDDGSGGDETDFASILLPDNVTGVAWAVTEWSATDTIDNDLDGETDEGDENGVKLVALTVTYRDSGEQKTYNLNFYKTEMM